MSGAATSGWRSSSRRNDRGPCLIAEPVEQHTGAAGCRGGPDDPWCNDRSRLRRPPLVPWGYGAGAGSSTRPAELAAASTPFVTTMETCARVSRGATSMVMRRGLRR